MLRLATIADRIRSRLARHAGNEDGFAAVEFAMIVPIMVVLFLGAVEFSEALTVDRRVTAVASATADLVGQSEEVSTSDLDDIMVIADSLLGRVNPVPLKITLMSITSDATGAYTVDWSYGDGASAYGQGSNYSKVPTEMALPNQSLIVSEVTYDFTPPVGHFLTGSITLAEQLFVLPRRVSKVELN